MDEKVRQRQALFELREKTLGQILDETVARIPDKDTRDADESEEDASPTRKPSSMPTATTARPGASLPIPSICSPKDSWR